jgi:hypothetical protein
MNCVCVCVCVLGMLFKFNELDGWIGKDYQCAPEPGHRMVAAFDDPIIMYFCIESWYNDTYVYLASLVCETSPNHVRSSDTC